MTMILMMIIIRIMKEDEEAKGKREKKTRGNAKLSLKTLLHNCGNLAQGRAMIYVRIPSDTPSSHNSLKLSLIATLFTLSFLFFFSSRCVSSSSK